MIHTNTYGLRAHKEIGVLETKMKGFSEPKLKYAIAWVARLMLGVGAVAVVSVEAHAEQSVVSTVRRLGCYSGDSLPGQLASCWVAINEPVGDAAGCSQKRDLRWDPTTPMGGRMFAMLTAAYLAKRRVSFTVADYCFPTQPSHPTFRYAYLAD